MSNDTRVLLLYEANKTSLVVAYLLWFFVGMFGGHNFYLERIGVAVAQLILTLTNHRYADARRQSTQGGGTWNVSLLLTVW